MGRDSLPYWWPINSNSFTLSRPDESFSQTYSFPTDSVFWPEYNIWVCSGCQIYYNDSIFYVRRDPECAYCWDYSYNRVEWKHLFCESKLSRILDIVPSSRLVLKDGDYMEWLNEDSILQTGVTFIGFKRRAEFEGKTLRYVNDTVRWLMPEIDSFYVNNTWVLPYDSVSIHDTIWFLGNPYSEGDTLPFIDQKDYWYYENGGFWVGNDDTLQIIFPDDSPTNELDSFNFNGNWIKNGDFVFIPDPPTPQLVYYNINGKNYYNGSSLIVDTLFTNELDSLFYGTWLKNGDTLKITFPDDSNTNELDSLKINGIWYSNGDSITIAGGEDTCLWKKLGSGIIAKMDNIGVGDTAWQNVAITGKNRVVGGAGVSGTSTAESAHGVLGYATEIDGNGVWGISHSNYGIRGDSYSSYSGYFNSPLGLLTNKISIGTDVSVKYTLPAVDGDSLEFLRTDGHGNVYWDAPHVTILDSIPIFSGDSTMVIMTFGDGTIRWGRLPVYQEPTPDPIIYADSILIRYPMENLVPPCSGMDLLEFNRLVDCGFQNVWWNDVWYKLKDYSYTLDSAKVWVQNNYGKWNIDQYGINHINKVGIGAVSDNSFMLNVTARPNTTALMIKGYNDSYNQISGYSGDGTNNFSVYNNGGIYSKTSLKVGETGETITRTGTMASMDFWAGTQAEWNANTPKNGIYPQAETTFWTIKD